MIAPISFPIWLLLVAMIGMPLHFYLRMHHRQTRLHYAFFSSLTIALAMLICFAAALAGPDARRTIPGILNCISLSLSFGMMFGVPVGLVFRQLVLIER